MFTAAFKNEIRKQIEVIFGDVKARCEINDSIYSRPYEIRRIFIDIIFLSKYIKNFEKIL